MEKLQSCNDYPLGAGVFFREWMVQRMKTWVYPAIQINGLPSLFKARKRLGCVG